MTFALTATLILAIGGFLLVLDRKDNRAHARHGLHAEQLEQLLQRIQAPELATVRHDVESVVELPQPPQSDDAYWQQSDDHARLIAQLEAAENAMFEN